MPLKDTAHQMKILLHNITHDLEKAMGRGNRAATQRVRTATVRLEKIAKTFRKESVLLERLRKRASNKKAKKK